MSGLVRPGQQWYALEGGMSTMAPPADEGLTPPTHQLKVICLPYRETEKVCSLVDAATQPAKDIISQQRSRTLRLTNTGQEVMPQHWRTCLLDLSIRIYNKPCQWKPFFCCRFFCFWVKAQRSKITNKHSWHSSNTEKTGDGGTP